MITNLALGTLMISLTVIIHTFGLMGVTHVIRHSPSGLPLDFKIA